MSAGSLIASVMALGAAVTSPAPLSSRHRPSDQEVRVTPLSLLNVGARMEERGNLAGARGLYRLLSDNPDGEIRSEAQFRLAKLAIARKEWRDAALLLRHILDDRPDSAVARLSLAQALAELGDENAALRELRAAQAGVLPADVARMVDRFSTALRAKKPFGASLELAFAPDSNISSATNSDSLGTVFGDFEINPDSRERSGTGLSARGQLFARHGLVRQVNLLARLSGSGDFYRDKRFDQNALDFSIGPEIAFGSTRLTIDAGATRRWYGFKAFQDSVRIGLNAGHSMGRTTYVRAIAGLARVNNHFNDLQDGTSWSGGLGAEHAVDERTGIGANISGQRDRLADPGYSLRSWRAQILGWREIGRATMTASVTLGGTRTDRRLLLFPDRRDDRFLALSLGGTARSLTAFGMAPFVRLTVERNHSTIAFYDYRRRRIEVGFTRAF